MEIKVYNISESIHEETLDEIDVKNIDKIFNKIFTPANISHLKVKCRATDVSIINDYNKDKEDFALEDFAEKLKTAELKQDGTRNNQIKIGSLFIKKNHDQLFLLKLENIEVIDKENHYEMRSSFSTETEYYKGCIFNNDLDDVIIIDKNKSVSKYWREVFLDLSLVKNEYDNSIELIELIREDRLFSEMIREKDNYTDIKKFTEDYLFNSDSFDKNELANKLRTNNKINELILNEIYSEETEEIDADFKVSKKALKENYEKKIQVSSDTYIYTENYRKLKKKEAIKYEDGKLILMVDSSFIETLPEELTGDD